MKILIISFHFPPANIIGAVRAGKLAKYLHTKGHDVRVLAGENYHYAQTLPLEIPAEKVTYTKWFDLNFALKGVLNKCRGCKQHSVQTQGAPKASSASPLGKSFIKKLYTSVFYMPDNHWGWIVPTIKAGRQMFGTWTPDLIIVSAGPFSGFIVADALSKKSGAPWIADYRDLWSENHDYPHFFWRKALDKWLEKNTLKSAKDIVTVSPLLAQKLSKLHKRDVGVIMNGYDLEDYDGALSADEKEDPLNTDHLRIVYTGKIYESFQDISPLLDACALLSKEEQYHLKVLFYGRDHTHVVSEAHTRGVGACVSAEGEISFKEAVSAQKSADALLFVLAHGEQADGVFTGKLFEYAGAGRPFLAIGRTEKTAVADFIRDKELGFVSDNPESIAAQLKEWIATKKAGQMLLSPPSEAKESLTREKQFDKFGF